MRPQLHLQRGPQEVSFSCDLSKPIGEASLPSPHLSLILSASSQERVRLRRLGREEAKFASSERPT